MSEIVHIADAVTAALNAATWELSFTAERRFLPLFELPEMKTLHVTVVPRSEESAIFARIKTQYDYAVDMGVQKKLEHAAEDEIAPLLNLCEQIGDFFRYKRLDAYPGASWVKAKREPIYVPEHLERLGQFTGIVTLTFRVVR